MYAKWRGWSNGRSAELIGVAQPIVRCGEGGMSRGREVVQRRVLAHSGQEPRRGIEGVEHIGHIHVTGPPRRVVSLHLDGATYDGRFSRALRVAR